MAFAGRSVRVPGPVVRTWRRDAGWGVVDRADDGEHGGSLYVAPLRTGVIHVVRGPAAVVCRAALTGLDLDGIREVTAKELGTDTASVDLEVVQELLEELVDLGVLHEVFEDGGPRAS